MPTKVPLLTLIQASLLLVLPVPVAGAAGSDGLIKLTASAGSGPAGRIEVHGAAGRYDRVAGRTLAISEKLQAEVSGDNPGAKIIASELTLKPAGTAKDAPIADVMSGIAPARRLEADKIFDVAFDPLGTLAQNAISLCNGLSPGARAAPGAHTLSMTVPLVWRVTAGRFNFKWVGYDRVAPSEDMTGNRDFYGERVTEDLETSVLVNVSCAPLAADAAIATAPSRTVAPPVAASKPVNAAPKAEHAATVPEAKPVVTRVSTAASESVAAAPSCKGGFVRQTGGADYMCLCPGNTHRVESGANAFACQKFAGRH